MTRRSFREVLASGASLGTWSQMASAEAVDMVGAAGFDFTIVDCEHGAFGLETAENLIRACDANGIAPVVRAPSLDPAFVGRALDAGASAVLVPGVETPAQARALVAASRFAPEGTRGACPCVRAGDHFVADWRAYAGRQRAETGVVALVETAAGLEQVEAICATEGLLALLVGPFDLSVSMGFQGDHRRDEVQAALARMIAAAHAAALPVLVPIFDPDPARAAEAQARFEADGVRHFVVGTDKIILATALRAYAGALRPSRPNPSPPDPSPPHPAPSDAAKRRM